MSLPAPRPGLVFRYSYLWKRESDAGQEEGAKDRPCAVVVAFEDAAGQTAVYALPITHSAPRAPDVGIEIPRVTKERLGLDSERSWVVISEANHFVWPGPDLRPAPGRGLESVAYGFIPPGLFKIVRDRFLALDLQRRVTVVPRTE